MSNEIILTQKNKEDIHNLYNETPDLILITKKVFNNENLDGRSKEGRAVRKFLVEQGLKYRTTKTESQKEIILLDQHKDFINRNCVNMTAYEMAKILFPESDIVSTLSKECRVILEYLRENQPDKIKDSESAVGVDYRAPSTIAEATHLVNKSTAQELIFNKLSTQDRHGIQAYIRFINSPRVIQIINSYTDQSDRDLFESEFTRFTWDKPDLTADDITLYIGVCQDIITNKRLVKHLEKLNLMFEEVNDNSDLTVRMADVIKSKSEEYDKVQKRIESSIKKLSGDRAARMKKKNENSASFLSLVEAFQQEDERRRLLLIAKAKRETVKNEADRLESLDEYLSRIVGISKQEVL